MKKLFLASFLCLSLSSSGWAALIYGWDFAGLPDATNGTPATIGATVGSGGLLNISAFNLNSPGSPQGSGCERTAFSGTSINAFPGGEPGTPLYGMALAIANQTANNKSLYFSFNMAGYQDLVVSFATRGTGTGFNSGLWAWSVNGSDYTTLDGINTATRVTSFSLATVDLSAVTALDNAPAAWLRLTYSGATSASGNNRLDNIQFNASAVPEPASFALGGLGLLLMALFRRRN
jgi:hypothetical protein